jgi:AraC-like DNA-binding protein
MKTEPKLCAGVESVLSTVPESKVRSFARGGGLDAADKTGGALSAQEPAGSNDGSESGGHHLANSLQSLARIVARMTGLQLRVLWHDASEGAMAGGTLGRCPRSRRRHGVKQPAVCASCHLRRWNPAVAADGGGRRFTGRCGIRNFCVSLRAQARGRLTLILQAMVVSSVCAARRKRPAGRGRWVRERGSGKVTAEAFNDAVALVRLLVGDWLAAAEAGLAGRELETAARAPRDIRPEAERVRTTRIMAGRLDAPAHAGHLGNIVAAMRDFVYQNYHRPFGLNEVAAAIKMNASYLSALFSQSTGQKFRQFLEAVRMAKARELLCDPRNRIGEVAGATGYASPDAFRHAFKAREGLAPEAWRAKR